MLSLNLIERLFDAREFDRLLDSVAGNGLELPLPLRIGLSQAAAGVVAVALRRTVDLSYTHTLLAERMATFLLAAQSDDGSFDADPLITAAAAAAWGRMLTERHAGPGSPIAAGRTMAMAALAQMQTDDGLFRSTNDRSLEDMEMTAAFVLFLLGNDDAFCSAIRIADLCRWFEQRHARLDRMTQRLWQMSRDPGHTGRRHLQTIAA